MSIVGRALDPFFNDPGFWTPQDYGRGRLTTMTPAADRTYYGRFVPQRNMVINLMYVFYTTAGANPTDLYGGIYDSTGALVAGDENLAVNCSTASQGYTITGDGGTPLAEVTAGETYFAAFTRDNATGAVLAREYETYFLANAITDITSDRNDSLILTAAEAGPLANPISASVVYNVAAVTPSPMIFLEEAT